MSSSDAPGSGRRYTPTALIGKGAFGKVYRARMETGSGFQKLVALKAIHPHLMNDDEVVKRSRDEARLLGLLDHPSIVKVDGLIWLADRWTMVMEFVQGTDLHRLSRHVGPLPTQVALAVTRAVADALHYAHRLATDQEGTPLRLLHRDLKPSNLMLSARGEVSILDFGTARADFLFREARTVNLQIGTFPYMAPEFQDTGQASAAVDIYALGATLFELLLGARYDKCPVSEAPYHEHRDRKLDELRSALSGGDWELVSLVTDMLDYAPRRRPSASEVVQRIDGIMVDRADREGLALWAARVLPDLVAPPRELPADDLVDRTFTEMPSPLIERESGPLCEDPVLPPAGSSPSSEAPEPAEKSPAAGVSGSELSRPRPAPRVATGLIVVALLGALGLWLLTARERDASLLEPSQVSGEGTGSASAYREVPIDLVPERHESEPIPNESRAEELEHPAQLTEASVEEAGEPDVASIAAPLPVLAPPQRAVQVRQTSPPPTEHTATVEPGNGDVASFQATPAVLEPAQELTEAPESAGSAGSQCAVTVQGLEAATLSKEAFGGDLVDLPARVTAGSWSLSGAFPGEPVSDKGHYVIGAEWELARFDCTDTEARQRGRCALVRLR